MEHVWAIALGGENRESNMAPALVEPHKTKTAQDRKTKARNDRIRKRHLGIRKPSKMAGSRDSKWKRKMNGQVVLRDA